MNFIRSFFLVLSLIWCPVSFATERVAPECLNEQIAQDALLGQLAEWRAERAKGNNAKPPGILIDLTWTDTRYELPGWEKRSWDQIVNIYEHKTIFGMVYHSTLKRSVIQLHYMVNTNTLGVSQIKFKTSPAQGCGNEKLHGLKVGEAPDNGVENVALVNSETLVALEEKIPGDCGGYVRVNTYVPDFQVRSYGYTEPSGRVVVMVGWVDVGGYLTENYFGGRGGCR